MTEVFTRTKCDRCEATHEREGVHKLSLPGGWSAVLMRREPVATEVEVRREVELCPDCTRDALAATCFVGAVKARAS